MVGLTWEGKYTAEGKRVAPVRLALPFQDVETVNESAQTRNLMLDLFARNQPGEWRNRLIWGDKKYVLPSLLPEFAGKINLVYIDPPFATGADFSYTAQVPDGPDTQGEQSATFVKQPSMLEQKAYRDTWGRGLDGCVRTGRAHRHDGVGAAPPSALGPLLCSHDLAQQRFPARLELLSLVCK